jgi:hypothetical protein
MYRGPEPRVLLVYEPNEVEIGFITKPQVRVELFSWLKLLFAISLMYLNFEEVGVGGQYDGRRPTCPLCSSFLLIAPFLVPLLL